MIPLCGFIHASQFSLVVFVLICAAIASAFLGAVSYAQHGILESAVTIPFTRVFIAVGVYGLAIAGVVYSEVLSRVFIPLGPIFLFGTVSFAVSIGFTRMGTSMARAIPLGWLVGFQAFRLPLELVLNDWYRSGTIPHTMTWHGSNWDILSGILACIACVFVNNRRWLAWGFNVIGIVLLLNVGRVAIMSSPVPSGWQVDPPLELILFLPYAYIVPVCVGGAALGHTLLTRKLLTTIDSTSSSDS
jgi:hypothetical protein